MFINRHGELKVRVRGVDKALRTLANTNEQTRRAAYEGVSEAADYLKDIIQEKIGKYQSTGGDGGGAWAKLKVDTIFRKMKKYGVGDKPLLASGALRDSFYVKKGGEGTISASVASKDPKLVYHIEGNSRLPKRDPMIVTAIEEMDMCHDIIEDAINKVYSGGALR